MNRRPAHVVTHRLPSSVLRLFERPLAPGCAGMAHGCYGYDERSAAPLVRQESAGTALVVILETGEPIRVGDGARATRNAGGFVAGLTDAPTRTEHAGHQAGVQLNLTPLAARRVLGVPLGELAHRVFAASDVLPRAHRALPRRLAELESWEERLDAVEALLAAAAEPPAGFRELAWAVAQIERSRGGVRIAALARELGWSERRLERAFGEHVGVPPKLFARLTRFEALMAAVRRGSHGSWASAAHALGYADQSHLVRDVKQFAGVPPSGALASARPQEPALAQ